QPAPLLRNCDLEVGPMRRAEEAGGHAAEFVCRSPLADPDGPWARAGNVAEGAAESAQALPARVEGDLGDRQVRVAEQRHRPFNAAGEQVPVRRDAEGLFERSREMS